MSEAGLAEPAGAQMELRTSVAPPHTTATDRALPIFILASLVVHATAMLPSLLRGDPPKAKVAQEIPVEVIQLPPKPAEKPQPPAPKPSAPKVVRQEPPKSPPKPLKTARQDPPKEQPKPAPKSSPQKPPSKVERKTDNVAERYRQLIGAMPAIALPSNTSVGADEVSYSQLVLSKVAKAKKEGRYNGVPGAASVSFSLGDVGEVIKVEIVRPSGDKSLDDEAIAMVKRGAPYPPPPPGGRRDYTITLRFQALI